MYFYCCQQQITCSLIQINKSDKRYKYSRAQKSLENWSVCSKMALVEVLRCVTNIICLLNINNLQCAVHN